MAQIDDTKKTGQGSNFYKPATSGETPSELAARRKKLKRAAGRMPVTPSSRAAERGHSTAGRSLGLLNPHKAAAEAPRLATNELQQAWEAGHEVGYALGSEDGWDLATRDTNAAVDSYSKRVEALVAGLIERHASELRAAAPDLEPRPILDAKAIEDIVEQRVAVLSRERRKEASRVEVKSFGSYDELEAAMTGQPIVRLQGPPPKRLFGF